MIKHSLFAFCLLCGFDLCAQTVPAAISYQAVVRDLNGDELTNTDITVDFAIRKSTFDGLLSYEESHTLIPTNQFGLFTAKIGTGVNTGMGLYSSLNQIPWGDDNYFLEVRAVIPGQGTPLLLGVSQLLSVPYALYAFKADSVEHEADGDPNNELIQDLSLDGSVLSIHENNTEHLVDLSPIGYATWNKVNGVVYNNTEMVGVGTAIPQSTFMVSGSFATKVIRLSNTEVTLDDTNEHTHVFICDVTDDDISVGLVSATTCHGRTYKFRKFFTGANTSNNVILTPAQGEQIDGMSSYVMSNPLAEYVTIISDGIGWYVIDHSKE